MKLLKLNLEIKKVNGNYIHLKLTRLKTLLISI